MRKLFICLSILLSQICANGQYIIRVAGNDSCGTVGDGMPAIKASLARSNSFNVHNEVCMDAAGNLYIGENTTTAYSCRVRKMDAATGIITTVVGKMNVPVTATDTIDNIPATNALLPDVGGICIDKMGNLLIADCHARVRKVDLVTGIITTIAGNGGSGYFGNGGPATAATLWGPTDVAVDNDNNVYIVEAANVMIRKVEAATGNIRRVAGTGGPGYYINGTPAISSPLNSPSAICVDAANNFYIADGSARIARVDIATGIITTVAGSGGGPLGDGGPATAATIKIAANIAMDKTGNLYIADNRNFRVRKVDVLTGTINTIAGNGTAVGNIDSVGDNGPATAAMIFPAGMCFDSCGNLFVRTTTCHVRAIVPSIPANNILCGLFINKTPQTVPGQSNISIFPNPNKGSFMVNVTTPANEPAQMLITDITGRKIKDAVISTNKEVPLQLDVPGMYFVTVTTENGRWNKKVVVDP
ncbi:MAG: Ig domain protein group 1 domain protein [Flavipsychrobacter sp.]|jgi:hypothetical protein|nr:Ig domain protein group 1 domain protein [Flavipsychrobacter sp.]